MSTEATAIYENGVLRLLTPVSLRERVRVRVRILEEDVADDDLERAEAALIAAGVIGPACADVEVNAVSGARRAEIARLYAVGGPLSELIIAEREGR